MLPSLRKVLLILFSCVYSIKRYRLTASVQRSSIIILHVMPFITAPVMDLTHSHSSQYYAKIAINHRETTNATHPDKVTFERLSEVRGKAILATARHAAEISLTAELGSAQNRLVWRYQKPADYPIKLYDKYLSFIAVSLSPHVNRVY